MKILLALIVVELFGSCELSSRLFHLVSWDVSTQNNQAAYFSSAFYWCLTNCFYKHIVQYLVEAELKYKLGTKP